MLDRINATSYPPPNGGDRWCYDTVRYVCSNDTYAGLVSWAGQQATATALPARWDTDTHRAIIRERKRRGQMTYIRRGAGPFAGVAFCARCGSALPD